MDDIALTLFGAGLTTVLGIIGFFVKKAFTQIDGKAEKADVTACEKELKALSTRFATKEEVTEIKQRMDKLENGIDFLKENSVRKDDFVIRITELSGKFDDLNSFLRGK